MLKYGFFNAVSNDRVYEAETFNTFFEGLISSNGIFEGVGEGFVVSPSGSGRVLNVGTGKAMVNSCWVRNNSTETITISGAHTTFNRYDMITLKWDSTNRLITLALTEGTPATQAVKPQPKRTLTEWEIVLAYVYSPANTTALTAANIEDCRYDTSLCGVITGLVKQVDTTTLYNQYAAKFAEIEAQLLSWENQQKTAFDTWYAALTDELQVNTYIKRNTYNFTTEARRTYIDLPASLAYTTNDLLDVFANGILLVQNVDYTIQKNEVENVWMINIPNGIPTDTKVTMYCTKSQIGMQ